MSCHVCDARDAAFSSLVATRSFELGNLATNPAEIPYKLAAECHFDSVPIRGDAPISKRLCLASEARARVGADVLKGNSRH
jgi:hypothetical protein